MQSASLLFSHVSPAATYHLHLQALKQFKGQSDYLSGKPACFKRLYQVTNHPVFRTTIVSAIVVNTIVLAMERSVASLFSRRFSNAWRSSYVSCKKCIWNIFFLFGRYPISDDERRVWEIINNSLTVLFACEVTIKVAAVGFRTFLKDRFNVFDAIVVAVSSIELLISGFQSMSSPSSPQSTVAIQTTLLIDYSDPDFSWPETFAPSPAAQQSAAFSSNIAAFRALRLLRVLKLFGNLSSLQLLLRAFTSSASSILYDFFHCPALFIYSFH